MSRSSELLKAAAAALEDGNDPFARSFLVEHDVTFDECMDMADSLALGATLIAWAMEHPKEAVAAARGAGTGLKHHAFMRAMDRLNAKV
jgi:hypothetical protein